MACAPSGNCFRCRIAVIDSADCKSAGRTDLEVYVPLLAANRALTGLMTQVSIRSSRLNQP